MAKKSIEGHEHSGKKPLTLVEQGKGLARLQKEGLSIIDIVIRLKEDLNWTEKDVRERIDLWHDEQKRAKEMLKQLETIEETIQSLQKSLQELTAE